MSAVEWLTLDMVLDFHAEQLALFGGPQGVRDAGLLEATLARPLNKRAYGETRIEALAAAYAFAVARNHPFVDGNKRTALASMIVFLGLNGIEFDASPEQTTAIFLALAAGEVEEDLLADWIAGSSHPI